MSLVFANISAVQQAKLSQYLQFTHLKYYNGVLKRLTGTVKFDLLYVYDNQDVLQMV